jgi:hypothetical protein
MYKQLFLLFLGLTLLPNLSSAQDNPDKPKFSMGLPLEHDELYDEFEVKATLTSENYRDVDSKASVKKWAPTPGSQGSYGTCAAWATGYCARTILEAKKNGWTDKKTITDNIFSYGFIYRVTSSSSNCWGAFTSECVRNMRDVGIPTYKEYSIHCPSSAIPKSVYNKAAKRKIKGYVKLWDEYTNNLKERVGLVKKSLAEGNPVVISMICPNSFHYPTGKVWIPTESPNDNPSNPHGRHAMCVVGYDDNMYGGAFEIQNSWGPSWGNGGYIWVKYEDFADFVYQAIELLQFDTPAPTEEVELAGEVRFMRDDRMEMKASYNANSMYEMNQAYRSGTRFRLYISNNEPAYVYAFGSDLTNKTYQVFPHKPNVSAALTYSKNDVPIPSEDKHVRMDGTVGTDFLCVIYSKEALNLDEIRRKVESYSSRYTFREKVEKALGDKLMKGSEVNYTRSGGKMGFQAKAKGKTCAAMFVAMEHID